MANSVTARFNDDCKVFVSMSDDTTVEKAVIIDAEGNETDIGGGGGGSNTATVQVTYTLPPEVSSIDDLEFSSSTVKLEYDEKDNVIVYVYSPLYGLPYSELGTITEMKIPLYENCKSNLNGISYSVEEVGSLSIDVSNSRVVSGDAEIIGNDLYVTGDCVLNLALYIND